MSQETIRTPLGKARGLGSAKSGVSHWWWQRVTAVALIPLGLYLMTQAGYFLPVPGDYSSLIVQIADPVTSLVIILTVIFGFYHGALGIQSIIEDYVHGEGLKISLLLLNKILFAGLGVTCIYAVLYISFALYGQTPSL